MEPVKSVAQSRTDLESITSLDNNLPKSKENGLRRPRKVSFEAGKYQLFIR